MPGDWCNVRSAVLLLTWCGCGAASPSPTLRVDRRTVVGNPFALGGGRQACCLALANSFCSFSFLQVLVWCCTWYTSRTVRF